MFKILIAATTIALSTLSIIWAIKRYNKSSPFKFPKAVQSVSSLRYNAYSSAFEGQECTVKGFCINRNRIQDTLTLFLADSIRGAYTTPIRCVITKKHEFNFNSVANDAVVVITGIISFLGQELYLKEVHIISI